MAQNHGQPIVLSPRKRAQLRFVGVAVLVAGIVAGGLLYWLRTQGQDVSNDLSMVGYNRAQSRQMEMLYGKSGRLFQDLTDALKSPGTQAFILAGGAILFALGCFVAASRDSGQPERQMRPPDQPD